MICWLLCIVIKLLTFVSLYVATCLVVRRELFRGSWRFLLLSKRVSLAWKKITCTKSEIHCMDKNMLTVTFSPCLSFCALLYVFFSPLLSHLPWHWGKQFHPKYWYGVKFKMNKIVFLLPCWPGIPKNCQRSSHKIYVWIIFFHRERVLIRGPYRHGKNKLQ
jgi:hypothetical protein